MDKKIAILCIAMMGVVSVACGKGLIREVVNSSPLVISPMVTDEPGSRSACPVPSKRPEPTATLVPRTVPTKPAHTTIGPGESRQVIIVKFREGSRIRLRYGVLISLGDDDVESVLTVLEQYSVDSIERLFDRPEEDLERERREGQERSGKELADLNLYYRLHVQAETQVEELIDALNELDLVEIAYPAPLPMPPPALPGRADSKE